MLCKSISAMASAALVATISLSSGAYAHGCGHGFGHGFGSFVRYSMASSSYEAQLRARKAAEIRAIAAAKHRKQIEMQQAIAARKAQSAEVAANTEHKAETTTTTAKTDKKVVTVAAADTTCKRFVPEVGATVTVDCARN
jgi:hypothetical protein